MDTKVYYSIASFAIIGYLCSVYLFKFVMGEHLNISVEQARKTIKPLSHNLFNVGPFVRILQGIETTDIVTVLT